MKSHEVLKAINIINKFKSQPGGEAYQNNELNNFKFITECSDDIFKMNDDAITDLLRYYEESINHPKCGDLEWDHSYSPCYRANYECENCLTNCYFVWSDIFYEEIYNKSGDHARADLYKCKYGRQLSNLNSLKEYWAAVQIIRKCN